jgi:hypothetical protein
VTNLDELDVDDALVLAFTCPCRKQMRLAHLLDRERLVYTHRQLTRQLTRIRAMALTGTLDPAEVLAVIGDTGMCSLTADDRRVTV